MIRSRDEFLVATDAAYGLIALLGTSNGAVRDEEPFLIVHSAHVTLCPTYEFNAYSILEEDEAETTHVPVQLCIALGEQDDALPELTAGSDHC